MSKTEELINIIKDDNMSDLDHFLGSVSSSNVDFEILYDTIKDIQNACVYKIFGTFIYTYGYATKVVESTNKGIYYLCKGDRLSGQKSITMLHTTGGGMLDDSDDIWNTACNDMYKAMNEYIDMEERYEQEINKNGDLEEKIKLLEAENIELKYRPNGEGYEEAKSDFELHQ